MANKINNIMKDKSHEWHESALNTIKNGGNIEGSLETNKGFISSLLSYFESAGNYEACIILFDKFKDLV